MNATLKRKAVVTITLTEEEAANVLYGLEEQEEGENEALDELYRVLDEALNEPEDDDDFEDED